MSNVVEQPAKDHTTKWWSQAVNLSRLALTISLPSKKKEKRQEMEIVKAMVQTWRAEGLCKMENTINSFHKHVGKKGDSIEY